MNSLGNKEALYVAECLIDYDHKKKRREKKRLDEYIEKKKEIRHTKKSLILLTALAVLMISLCVVMITMEMHVREQGARIAELKTQVSEMKKQNKEAEKRLSSSVDYQWVRKEALRLGMSQATEDQVIYYSVEDGDYMVQLDDIPVS